MKKILLFLSLIITILFSSCEEVINVDLNTAAPKLVIEASINWEKGTTGSQQIIKLSTTTSFYSSIVPAVSGALVTVTNSSNTIFSFIENANTGQYICSNFIPNLNEIYTLKVVINGQTYTATETLKSVATITSIEQNNEGGFTGNKIEIKAVYTDPANEENYYLYRYKYPSSTKFDYFTDEDKFFQGNVFFSSSFTDDLKQGDAINIVHYGISKNYYNYLSILLNLTGDSSGSPFQSPPSTVRGNIINQTNFDNYALGYFSLSQTDTRNYTIQ